MKIQTKRKLLELKRIPTKFQTSVGSFVIFEPNNPKFEKYVNAFKYYVTEIDMNIINKNSKRKYENSCKDDDSDDESMDEGEIRQRSPPNKKRKLNENLNKLNKINDEKKKEYENPCGVLTRMAREKSHSGDVEIAKQFYSASIKLDANNAQVHFEVECLYNWIYHK